MTGVEVAENDQCSFDTLLSAAACLSTRVEEITPVAEVDPASSPKAGTSSPKAGSAAAPVLSLILGPKKTAGGKKSCPHGRQKSKCRDCGGSGICVHGRQKHRCKECGGSSICHHGRERSYCKQCGGSSICLHGKEKTYCRECGGSSLCQHGRRKSDCKECGGSSICMHQKLKSRCRDCGGSQICTHGKIKSACKACGGSSICIHSRERSYCRDCKGSQICPHMKQKSKCIQCKAIRDSLLRDSEGAMITNSDMSSDFKILPSAANLQFRAIMATSEVPSGVVPAPSACLDSAAAPLAGVLLLQPISSMPSGVMLPPGAHVVPGVPFLPSGSAKLEHDEPSGCHLPPSSSLVPPPTLPDTAQAVAPSMPSVPEHSQPIKLAATVEQNDQYRTMNVMAVMP